MAISQYTSTSIPELSFKKTDILPSQLYSLEPIGIGTFLVESLSSYISRLATAHSVTFPTIMAKIINPSQYSGVSLHNTINGLSTFTSKVFHAAEINTQRDGLSLLTLWYWSSVISSKDLNKDSHVWCPKCYETWRTHKRVIYTPLVWTLKCLRICPIHYCELENSCPYSDCGKTLKKIGEPGYCPYCHRLLRKFSSASFRDNTSNISMDPWIQWVISNCKYLILSPNEDKLPPTISTSQKALCAIIDHLGGVAHAARELGLANTTIAKWSLPRPITLPNILKLSWKVGKHVNEILTGEFELISSPTVRKRSSRRYPVGYIEAEVAKALSGDSPPCTLRELSQTIGCSYPTLRKYIPDIKNSIKRNPTLESRPKLDLHKDIDKAIARQEIVHWLNQNEVLSAKEISRRVGIHQSSMRSCFPALYEEALASYRQRVIQKKLDIINDMKTYLVAPSIPPKSLAEIADEFCVNVQSLQRLNAEICRKIQQMHREYYQESTSTARSTVRRSLSYEEVKCIVNKVRRLSPPISREEFFRRYGYSVRKYPDLMNIIGALHDDYKSRMMKVKSQEIRKAIIYLHQNSQYPSQVKIKNILQQRSLSSWQVEEIKKIITELGFSKYKLDKL